MRLTTVAVIYFIITIWCVVITLLYVYRDDNGLNKVSDNICPFHMVQLLEDKIQHLSVFADTRRADTETKIPDE